MDITMSPIGYVRNHVTIKKDVDWGEDVSVAGNELTVRGLDAMDGTPVLDIKPYYPAFDRRDAHVPEWVDRLMAQYF